MSFLIMYLPLLYTPKYLYLLDYLALINVSENEDDFDSDLILRSEYLVLIESEEDARACRVIDLAPVAFDPETGPRRFAIIDTDKGLAEICRQLHFIFIIQFLEYLPFQEFHLREIAVISRFHISAPRDVFAEVSSDGSSALKRYCLLLCLSFIYSPLCCMSAM